ncbi:MAG: hypothetical protein ACXABY_04900 [Candidatus Thorarchaeota archaeon]
MSKEQQAKIDWLTLANRYMRLSSQRQKIEPNTSEFNNLCERMLRVAELEEEAYNIYLSVKKNNTLSF